MVGMVLLQRMVCPAAGAAAGLRGRMGGVTLRALSGLGKGQDLLPLEKLHERDPLERTSISGYGDGVFEFNEEYLVEGPVLALPNCFFEWHVREDVGLDVLNEDALRLFTLIKPRLELLIVGAGHRVQERLRPELVDSFRNMGIVLDQMNTTSAMSTFNVLMTEDRQVGVALLPVRGEEVPYWEQGS